MDPVAQHLAQNHGIISRLEARDLGLTDRKITYRVKQGHWIAIAPGTFRLAGSPPSWAGNARAAALSVDGLASHGTAATAWKIDGWDQTRIEVVVPTNRRPQERPGITIHRSTQMDLADPHVANGIPVTGLARTVLDVAASASRKRLEWTVDAVLRSGALDWPALYGVLARHSARGRDGCGRLRLLVDDRFGDNVVPDSKFNRMVGQLLTDAGIAGFVFEYEILDRGRFLGRADLAFVDERVAIECDSKRYHLNTHSFVHDRRRQNKITTAGWTVIQFTWDDYIDQPAVIVDDVYNALRLSKLKNGV